MFSVDSLSLKNVKFSAHFQAFPFLCGMNHEFITEGDKIFMFVAGFNTDIIPFLDIHNILDSYSRNGNGLVVPDGKSVLQKCTILTEV